MALVHALDIAARLDQRCGHAVCIGGGVVIDEAAGIGRYGAVKGCGNLGGHDAQGADQRINDLTGRCFIALEACSFGKSFVRGVVINGQINVFPIRRRVFWEQPQTGHVGRYNTFRNIVFRCMVAGDIIGTGGRQLRVGEHIGGFADLPQRAAQRSGAAYGIAVRPHMGQDQEAVVRLEPTSGFFNRHGVSSPSSSRPSFSSMPRRTSRIWVPWAMESSASNTSSGV